MATRGLLYRLGLCQLKLGELVSEDKFIVIKMTKDAESDAEVYSRVGYANTTKEADSIISKYLGEFGDVLFWLDINDVSAIREHVHDVWIVSRKGVRKCRFPRDSYVEEKYVGWLDFYDRADARELVEICGNSKRSKKVIALVNIDCAKIALAKVGGGDDILVSAIEAAELFVYGKRGLAFTENAGRLVNNYLWNNPAMHSTIYNAAKSVEMAVTFATTHSINYSNISASIFYASLCIKQSNFKSALRDMSGIVKKRISLRDLLLDCH